MRHFALPLLRRAIDIRIGKLPEKLNFPEPGMAFEATFFSGRDPERSRSVAGRCGPVFSGSRKSSPFACCQRDSMCCKDHEVPSAPVVVATVSGTRLPAQGHFGLAGNAGKVATPAPSVDDAAPET
jgi:hypothetical protein